MATDRILFEERQHLRTTWIWAIIAVTSVATLGSAYWAAINDDESTWGVITLVVVGLLVPAFVAFIRLRTVVTQDAVIVTLRPFVRRRIPRSEIASVEPRTYRPLREYGGWGLRGTRSNRAYTMDGDEGVQLLLTNGRRVLIGSRRHRELARALGWR